MSDFSKMFDEKCMMFATRIVNLCRFLDKERRGKHIIDQIMRSGMSIGAKFLMMVKNLSACLLPSLRQNVKTWECLLLKSHILILTRSEARIHLNSKI